MTFTNKCRLFLKRIYNSIIMFSEDQIATAQIAQLFGSELLRVQEGARTDSGSSPNILNIDPKQFLVPRNSSGQTTRRAEEERMMRLLQQEAEAACPIQQTQVIGSEVAQGGQNDQPSIKLEHQSPQISYPTINPSLAQQSNNGDVMERIACSLEKIALCLENSSTRSKTTKRVRKKITSK